MEYLENLDSWKDDESEEFSQGFYDDSIVDFHVKLNKFGGARGLTVFISQQDLIRRYLEELASLRGHLNMRDYKKTLNTTGPYDVEEPYLKQLKLIGGGRICFEFFPRTMYLHYGKNAKDSIIVVTNQPSTRLSLDEVARAKPVIAKTSKEECARITHHFDPIMISPVGSNYAAEKDAFQLPRELEYAIFQEQFNCLS